MTKPKVIILAVCLLLVVAAVLFVWNSQNTDPLLGAKPAITTDDATAPEQSVSQAPASFDKKQYSLTDPSSIWVVVNKQNGIPIRFTPDLAIPDVRLRLASSEQQMQIRPDIVPAIQQMFQDAKKDGVNLVFGSGYRSGNLQAQFYNSYKAKDGQTAADRYSARPGHSEHQTGLAFDLTSPGGKCHLETCWEDTLEGKWAAKNAYKYGFILRYQDGKESITGYQYEPWHFRYVGTDLADEINQTGQTLEEFFGLPPAPNYD